LESREFAIFYLHCVFIKKKKKKIIPGSRINYCG
jgi:hypothetical protein